MKRTTLRIAALALVTLAGLAVVAAGAPSTALAAPCCSACEEGLEVCIQECSDDPACISACGAWWGSHCFHWCNYDC